MRPRSDCACVAQVDALEHERAQPAHRAADLVALDDVARGRRALDQVAHQRVDPLRHRRAEHLRSRPRGSSVVGQHPGAQRVVDVVVDVGDAVDEPDDPPLERRRQIGPGVAQDAVAHLLGQVEPAAVALEPLDDPQRVLVVAEADAVARRGGDWSSACSPMWPNGGWPRSWPSAIASVRSSLSASARATVRAMPDRLERVGQPGAVVVALGRDEDLGLVLEPPERLGVHDPVAVALERRAQRRVVLRDRAPRRVGPRRERRQPVALELPPSARGRAPGEACPGDGHGGILPGGAAARRRSGRRAGPRVPSSRRRRSRRSLDRRDPQPEPRIRRSARGRRPTRASGRRVRVRVSWFA